MEDEIPPPLELPDNFKTEIKKTTEKKETVSFQDMIKLKNKDKKKDKSPKFIDQKIGKGDKKMRVVIISDTHNGHNSLEIPEGDLLIHVK
jgi:hypothetical protein